MFFARTCLGGHDKLKRCVPSVLRHTLLLVIQDSPVFSLSFLLSPSLRPCFHALFPPIYFQTIHLFFYLSHPYSFSPCYVPYHDFISYQWLGAHDFVFWHMYSTHTWHKAEGCLSCLPERRYRVSLTLSLPKNEKSCSTTAIESFLSEPLSLQQLFLPHNYDRGLRKSFHYL